ncbi:MAG: hypothetical protein ABIA78_03150 [archaeon]
MRSAYTKEQKEFICEQYHLTREEGSLSKRSRITSIIFEEEYRRKDVAKKTVSDVTIQGIWKKRGLEEAISSSNRGGQRQGLNQKELIDLANECGGDFIEIVKEYYDRLGKPIPKSNDPKLRNLRDKLLKRGVSIINQPPLETYENNKSSWTDDWV